MVARLLLCQCIHTPAIPYIGGQVQGPVAHILLTKLPLVYKSAVYVLNIGVVTGGGGGLGRL